MTLSKNNLSLQKKGSEIKNIKFYFINFTFLFSIIAFLVFFYSIVGGRTFVRDVDGFEQYYKALIYYGRYLKGIAKNLLINHSLSFPRWDFAIGEGADVFTTFSFYTFGDPINLLTIIVPTDYMYIFYAFTIILRIYISGIIVSFLCYKCITLNYYAVLAASLTYCFTTWNVFCANSHFFFLNSSIFFPLLILGVEMVFDNRRPYLLIISIFLAGLNNFYFFYMYALLTAVYAVVKLIYLFNKDIKLLFKNLFILIGYSSIGVIMAATVIVPMLFVFMGDHRSVVAHDIEILYSLNYYLSLPSIFISTTDSAYSLRLGFSMIAFLSMIYVLTKKKEYKFIKILLIICLVFTFFPYFWSSI